MAHLFDLKTFKIFFKHPRTFLDACYFFLTWGGGSSLAYFFKYFIPVCVLAFHVCLYVIEVHSIALDAEFISSVLVLLPFAPLKPFKLI